jgi:hypothetical protein
LRRRAKPWRCQLRRAGLRRRQSTPRQRLNHATLPRRPLIQLVLPDDAKPHRCAQRSDDADIRKGVLKAISKTLPRTESTELHRENRGVRVLPAVVPDLCEMIDVSHFGRSHIHGMGLVKA